VALFKPFFGVGRWGWVVGGWEWGMGSWGLGRRLLRRASSQ